MGSFTIPVMIALMATIVVLFIGIFSMARGGDFDQQHSVQLMFTRVGFQVAAIILVIVAAFYASGLA
ncbi:MAG: twin transmembrane helix small protein [Proteobacteria bacterium]|nr:twin transmembrane helix small protein [Pseudomonadota bacterium]